MSSIKVRKNHNKSKSQVLEILDELAKNPDASDNVDWSWESPTKEKLLLTGKGVASGCNGELTIGEGYVDVVLNLSWKAGVFKGMISKVLVEKLNSHLD